MQVNITDLDLTYDYYDTSFIAPDPAQLALPSTGTCAEQIPVTM